MYTDFYKLSGLPFQLTPDHRFFFDSRPHTKAASYLMYGLEAGEGFIVITGEIGAGKTTLVNHILTQIQGPDLLTAKVVTTQFDAENFLRIVATAFGVPQENTDKATVLHRIEAFLQQTHNSGKRALLFVDEVQNVPESSLEELRMLSNFQVEEKPLLQIFLVGQPQFRQTLAGPNLEQLRQRVIASYHLTPLDAEETRLYIEHRLERVGWQNDPIITDEAFQLIFEQTQGVPRRINLLADRLMLFGYLEDLHSFDAAAVKEVAVDLQCEGMPALGIQPSTGGFAQPTNGGSSVIHGLDRLAERIDSVERLVRAQDDKLSQILDRSTGQE
jgi:putative secretion ATPase (PEP-CTERM system associated)